MKDYKNFILVFFSILFTLIFIEFILYIKFNSIKKNHKFPGQTQKFLLFEEGSVFNNVNSIFKYHPNKTIKSSVYFNLEGKWFKEYDYEIITNNFGLVQRNNLKKEIPSILFLGDSFVEGQGSESWINKFNGNFNNFQIINGGILGTGPQQFELLEKHISTKFNTKKVLFFYIGDDLRRNIFNIPNNTMLCLESFKNCKGDENFYGFPLRDQNPENFLNQLNSYRDEILKKRNLLGSIKKKFKDFFYELNTLKIITNYMRQKFYFSKNEYIKKNFSSILNLYKKFGDSIIFIQLRNKNEIIYGKEYDTFYAEKYIKNLTNKHYICDFGNDINNFNKIDMHPNKKGYDHLFKCVNKILNKEFKG
tara:strand:+ start:327 stop:1415 length:1089 start_codon:yes stop_codon:yes gene_type:complete